MTPLIHSDETIGYCALACSSGYSRNLPESSKLAISDAVSPLCNDKSRQQRPLQQLIEAEAARQMPPHLLLLNQLIEAGSEAELETLLTEHAHLVNGDMLEMLQALEGQVQHQPPQVHHHALRKTKNGSLQSLLPQPPRLRKIRRNLSR